MIRKLLTIAALGAYICLVAFLFSKSADNGAANYSKIEKFVRTINQHNSDLDSAVLSLRLGLVHDYDELTRCERDLGELNLLDGKSSDSQEVRVPFQKFIGELIAQKVFLTADFKASHSVVRNAVAGFRHHAAKALDDLTAISSPDAAKIAKLERMGARFVVSGTLDDKSNFESAIVEFETLVQAEKYPDTKTLTRTLQHAKKLVKRRIELDGTIGTLVAVPIRPGTLAMMEEAAGHFQVEAKTADRFRVCLLIAIILLIAFCIFQYVVLFKHKAALFEANASLERRVAERIEELATTNQDLEEAIAKAEKLALVARYTDNAVVITDENAVIEWVNDGFTRITGYQPEEVIGKRRHELLFGPETGEKELQIMRTAVKSKLGFDIETVNYRKDGEPYWVEIEARPIKDKNQQVRRYISIENNITDRVNGEIERQKLNEKLVDASRTAGMAEMATGVLHNVGNILNSVNVSTDLIRKQFEKTALANLEKVTLLIAEHENDFGSFVEKDNRGQMIPQYMTKVTGILRREHEMLTTEFQDLAENVDHIKKIISVQQTMAKSSGWWQELLPAELVNHSIVANKAALASQNVKITRDIEMPLPALVSDKHKILQILVNLIKNANDAMQEFGTEDPEIAIRVFQCDDDIVFTVADNGIGISSDNVEKIFSHGFTTKETGHGFGLHSSANAATAIGGTLTVSSDGVGAGAAFHLRIPLDCSPQLAAGAV